MKKIIALFMVVILGISLCACSATNDNSTLKKEDMIQSATTLAVNDLFSAASENVVNAKDKYVGKYYKVSGFVYDISDEYCSLLFVADYDSDKGYANIYLSKDDLSMIKTNERITVVGEISDVSDKRFTMNTAYYIDNIFTLEAEVVSLVYGSISDKYPSYCTATIKGFVDNMVAPLCDIRFEGEDISTLKENDIITVKGNLYLYGNDNRHVHYGQNVLCEMKNVELVSK